MIAITETDPPSAPSLASSLAHGVPRAYAVLFFSGNVWLGAFLLAVSLLSPAVGISGLLGVGAAGVLAWVLGYEPANIRNGFFLFNPLLVCLTLGWLHGCYEFQPHIYAMLWVASVLGGFFLSVAMQHWVGIHFGLSAHSMPAVTVAYVLYFFGYAQFGPPTMPVAETHAWIDMTYLPPFVQAMLQAFGAMLFQPRALQGLLVFSALALASPLTCLMAAAAFTVGAETMSVLGYPMGPEGVSWCGFNFLLCGIALGSGYFVVSRASFLLAVCGAFLCALVALALSTALRYFGLPASALPYNLVVLVMVYALKQRRASSGLLPSPAPGSLPESAARQILLSNRRFPYLHVPAIRLPFEGERTVTQGFNGKLTHRAAWRYAVDFEVHVGGQRHSGSGESLKDYFSYGTPVLAPCSGVVVSQVTHVRDNAPGQNNPDENWGNQILLYADAGYYVRLAHLKQSSITVHAGQRVEAGSLLGHCGSSGRSPVPHLHLQIQDTTSTGAPTRFFCFKNFLQSATDEGRPQVLTAGIPVQGSRIQPAIPDPDLGTTLAGWLPGEYRYRISGEHGKSWEETLRLDFDEAGRYRLRSRRNSARLTGFLTENAFYATEFEGADESLLSYFAAGLARIPCITQSATWTDEISAVPYHRAAWRWIHGMLDPFIGPSLITGVYHTERDNAGWTIRSTYTGAAHHTLMHAAEHTPREITVRIASRRLVEKLEVRLANDRVICAELVNYETPG